jgi:hypothetical protein
VLVWTRTTRLAARGGRLHRPGDPRAGPRDADVTGRATASVWHRTAASRGETSGRTAPTQAVPWHDRFHHSGVVVPAMPLPRTHSCAPADADDSYPREAVVRTALARRLLHRRRGHGGSGRNLLSSRRSASAGRARRTSCPASGLLRTRSRQGAGAGDRFDPRHVAAAHDRKGDQGLVRRAQGLATRIVAKRSSGVCDRRDRGVANSIVSSADVGTSKAVVSAGTSGPLHHA